MLRGTPPAVGDATLAGCCCCCGCCCRCLGAGACSLLHVGLLPPAAAAAAAVVAAAFFDLLCAGVLSLPLTGASAAFAAGCLLLLLCPCAAWLTWILVLGAGSLLVATAVFTGITGGLPLVFNGGAPVPILLGGLFKPLWLLLGLFGAESVPDVLLV